MYNFVPLQLILLNMQIEIKNFRAVIDLCLILR